MSDSAGMNDHHDLFEGGESKSSSSQESGLCSTMLAVDESMGSLEELSENLHQHLDTHIDHTSLLHYELDMLRSQLNEKNRLISTQQITIKQLQDTLNETQKDLAEVRKVADMEITCKNETIDILQSDLIDSQQQHANCLQQVMNQNRVLSEIRGDDAVLIEKIAQLEKRLRKTTVRTVAIQTDLQSRHCENINTRQTNGSFKHPSPSFSPSSSYRHRNRVINLQPSFRFFDDDMVEDGDETDSPQSSHNFASHLISTSQQQRKFSESGCEANPSWAHQFQDLLTEIRQIQKILKLTKEQSGPEDPIVYTSRNKGSTVRSDELSEFWNTITEERQHRLQLDHMIRQIELDVLEVRSQIQSCKARLQVEQPSSSHWSYCPSSKCCCSAAHQDIAKSLYRCTDAEELLPNLNPKHRPTTSLFTLV